MRQIACIFKVCPFDHFSVCKVLQNNFLLAFPCRIIVFLVFPCLQKCFGNWLMQWKKLLTDEVFFLPEKLIILAIFTFFFSVAEQSCTADELQMFPHEEKIMQGLKKFISVWGHHVSLLWSQLQLNSCSGNGKHSPALVTGGLTQV